MPSSEPSDLRRQWRRRLRFAGLGTLVAIVGTAAFYLNGDDHTQTSYVLASGVIGSLIASFMLMIVAEYVGPKPRPGGDAPERLTAAVASIESSVSAVGHISTHGITSVRPKQAFPAEEWWKVLDGGSRLIMVGHALDKWCEQHMREDFEAALARVARNGEFVKLLTLPTAGRNVARVAQQRRKVYADRIETTHDVVAGVYDRLPAKARGRLMLRTLDPDVEMPYMLVANERVVMTCTYPAVTQNSDPMLTTAGSADSAWGQAILEDVHQLFEKHGRPVVLPRP